MKQTDVKQRVKDYRTTIPKHAVSIFARGTGESDTTTHTPLCKLWNTIQRNNQCNDNNDENH
jgi:hypothetical protein